MTAWSTRRFFSVLFGDMFAAHENRAPLAAAACETVDPCHRIGHMTIFVESFENLFKAAATKPFLNYIGARHSPELEGGFQYDACQAHAPAGRMKQFGIFGAAARQNFTARNEQVEGDDALTETTVNMVVFAVNVSGDGSAYTDGLGPGCDLQEPLSRKKSLDDFRQGHAALAGDDSFAGIEIQNPVKTVCQEDLGGQGAVAVAPTAGEYDTAFEAVQLVHQLLPGVESERLAFYARESSPSRNVSHAYPQKAFLQDLRLYFQRKHLIQRLRLLSPDR